MGPYTIYGPYYGVAKKDLHHGPLCSQSPTLSALPNLHAYVHMKNHFTFTTLMATLDRKKINYFKKL
jgi:hypothetical protein